LTAVEASEEYEIRAWRDLACAAGQQMPTGEGKGGDLLLMASGGWPAGAFKRALRADL
jgi:hypothetical protein